MLLLGWLHLLFGFNLNLGDLFVCLNVDWEIRLGFGFSFSRGVEAPPFFDFTFSWFILVDCLCEHPLAWKIRKQRVRRGRTHF